jgi:hypothetical protein
VRGRPAPMTLMSRRPTISSFGSPRLLVRRAAAQQRPHPMALIVAHKSQECNGLHRLAGQAARGTSCSFRRAGINKRALLSKPGSRKGPVSPQVPLAQGMLFDVRSQRSERSDSPDGAIRFCEAQPEARRLADTMRRQLLSWKAYKKRNQMGPIIGKRSPPCFRR